MATQKDSFTVYIIKIVFVRTNIRLLEKRRVIIMRAYKMLTMQSKL